MRKIDFFEAFVKLLSVLIVVIGVPCLIISFFYEPPKTIERNGYTYVLYEAPEPIINYQGYKYILKENTENDTQNPENNNINPDSDNNSDKPDING